MEQEFLIDLNTIIDYFGNKLPIAATAFINNIPAIISVITRIEILGWYNASSDQLNRLESFCKSALVYNLSEVIIQKTIELRQVYKIKLPDAIIAATALLNNLILITRNTNDFNSIEGLSLLNPWNI